MSRKKKVSLQRIFITIRGRPDTRSLMMTPKAKLILNLVLTGLTAGLWIPVWIVWHLMSKNGHLHDSQKAIQSIRLDLYDLEGALKHHEAIEKSIHKLAGKLPKSGNVLNIPLVRLYESRQGNSTTETAGTFKSKTETGTVGIGLKVGRVGVGAAASQGHTKGTMNSKSVTYVGKDEMTLIDNGTLVLKANSLSLTGAQFSRSVNFEDLLSCNVNRNELIISATTSEKNWLLALNSNEAAEIVADFVNFLSDSPSAKEIVGQGAKLLQTATASNKDTLSKFNQELVALESKLSELESPRAAIN